MDNRYAETHDYSTDEPASPFTATYIARTLRAYRPLIGLVLLAAAVGYLLLAIAAYLLVPAVRVTSLNFRLEFAGAEKGQYPNGKKFSSSDVISTPVMLKTFKQNDLQRFTKFSDFAGSVFVVESNEAREALAREFQARLADTRLTSIDRERIQRDYDLRAGSLSKNQFAINYMRRRRDALPEIVAKKTLHDILKNWAEYASNEQHVLEYQVALLSPDLAAPEAGHAENPIVATVKLRGNILRLIDSIRQIRALPNAELMRTADGLSLNDVAFRLEDDVRYGLDPLMNRIAAAGLDNRTETLRFLEAQLVYDERALETRVRAAETAQRTLSLYISAQPQPTGLTAAALASPTVTETPKNGEGETVMPQLSDSFLDRLIELTSRTADADFRQRMAEDYHRASMTIGPVGQAVAYDRALLEMVRKSGSIGQTDPNEVRTELAETRKDVRLLAHKVQELHKIVSQNLNPSTELLVASTPRTRVNRGISVKTLALVGIVLMLLTLTLTVLLSLFHSRIRDEDKAAALPAPST